MKPYDQSSHGAAFMAAQLHSRRVGLLKKTLPLMAIAMAGLFSWFTFFAAPPVADIVTLNMANGESNKLVMMQPKIEGYTRSNQPYDFSARRAIQDPTREGIIELEEIAATMPLGERGSAEIQAQGGIFDNINGRMRLERSFSLKTSDDVEAHFLSADIDISSSQLISNEPVTIRREGEHLTAQRLRILEGGEIFIFEGGVKFTIDSKQP